MHYLTPPTAGLFEGQKIKPLISLFARGGFRSKYKNNLEDSSAILSATSIPIIAALELADWNFKDFRQGRELAMGLKASAEAKTISYKIYNPESKKEFTPINTVLVRTVLASLDCLAPFDLQAYLKFHFTKVGDQTRLMINEYVDAAERQKTDSKALKDILDRLV